MLTFSLMTMVGTLRFAHPTHYHTTAVLERAPWVGEFDPLSGVVLHEQTEIMPQAAE